MKTKYLIIVILLTIYCNVRAQDPVFTQFLFLPETLNPSFTGSASALNAGLIHRRQWPDGNRQIETQYAFVNNLVTDNVGIGITILNQNETLANYNYIQVNGAFSYKIDLNNSWRLRFGLEGGYGRKDFNFGGLVLEDQININNGSISGSSIDPNFNDNVNNINFADFSIGVLVDEENTWLGASLKHLTRPDISFIENKNVPLDLFLSVHGGYYLSFDNSPTMLFPMDTDLLLSFNYMRQSQFNRLDIAAAIEMKKFTFGVIAATNPEGKTANSHIVTSLNPFVGLKFGEFRFGYSYDINTSALGQNQGIHELTLTWQSKNTCRDCDRYQFKLKDIIW